MNKLYQFKSKSLEFKDVDKKQGIVTGYFAAFNNVDSDGDVIRKGAFTRTIRENGPKSAKPRIKHLLNHMASQAVGVIQELYEDDYGLSYESKAGTHALGQDFIKMAESGIITEHSIGFTTIKRNQIQDYDGYRANPDLGWYELTELKLYEGSSLTAWGANENTPLTGLKGNKPDEIQDRISRLEKFCRNTDATDETIELLLLEIKQLGQFVQDLSTSSTTPAVEAVQPQKGLNAELILGFIETQKQLLTI